MKAATSVVDVVRLRLSIGGDQFILKRVKLWSALNAHSLWNRRIITRSTFNLFPRWHQKTNRRTRTTDKLSTITTTTLKQHNVNKKKKMKKKIKNHPHKIHLNISPNFLKQTNKKKKKKNSSPLMTSLGHIKVYIAHVTIWMISIAIKENAFARCIFAETRITTYRCRHARVCVN